MEGFLNPNEVLKQLNLTKDMIAADFGCGSGGWTIPLAKILQDGFVYAIDILNEPLSALKSKADLERVRNIKTIRANLESKNGSTIADNSVDWVLMINLLFQLEQKGNVLEEAKRILKKGGKLLVIEWKVNSIQGPKEGKISEEEAKKIAEDCGFELEKEFEAGYYHYGLIFKK